MGALEIIVKLDKFDEIAKRLPGVIDAILAKVANDVVADAQVRSRVDTGEMRAGWTAGQTGEHEWTVSNSVEHTIYNEFGTVHMSAQPMLTPAVEAQRSNFEQMFKALFEGL